jgi:hypothetical protein
MTISRYRAAGRGRIEMDMTVVSKLYEETDPRIVIAMLSTGKFMLLAECKNGDVTTYSLGFIGRESAYAAISKIAPASKA